MYDRVKACELEDVSVNELAVQRRRYRTDSVYAAACQSTASPVRHSLTAGFIIRSAEGFHLHKEHT